MTRVLVIDDNLEMARTLCDSLADRGYDAVPLGAGKRAIDLMERESFDAVITDLRMPDADGLTVLAAARRLDPVRPVLIMTAYGAVDTAIESIRRGAYHYLTKPFKHEELILFLALLDRAGAFEQSIRQGGLAVIDVRDDAKIARQLNGHWRAPLCECTRGGSIRPTNSSSTSSS